MVRAALSNHIEDEMLKQMVDGYIRAVILATPFLLLSTQVLQDAHWVGSGAAGTCTAIMFYRTTLTIQRRLSDFRIGSAIEGMFITWFLPTTLLFGGGLVTSIGAQPHGIWDEIGAHAVWLALCVLGGMCLGVLFLLAYAARSLLAGTAR